MGLELLPVLLLVVGATLIAWAFQRRRVLSRQPQGWPQVTGKVVDVGDGAKVPPRIEYRTFDGRRLRIPGPVGGLWTVGDEVDVLLDPADPTRARLALGQREAARVVTLLTWTGGVVLVLGLVMAAAFLL